MKEKLNIVTLMKVMARQPQRAKSLIKAQISNSEVAIFPILIWINCLGEWKCHCLCLFSLHSQKLNFHCLGFSKINRWCFTLQVGQPVSFSLCSEGGYTRPAGRLSCSAYFPPHQHLWGSCFQNTGVKVLLRTIWETDNQRPN